VDKLVQVARLHRRHHRVGLESGIEEVDSRILNLTDERVAIR